MADTARRARARLETVPRGKDVVRGCAGRSRPRRTIAMDAAFVDSFDRIVVEAAARLRAITDDAASTRPAPGKWSPKEIVGHLIDSAVNNQARFVRAQLQDDLIFPGYDQDAWVHV